MHIAFLAQILHYNFEFQLKAQILYSIDVILSPMEKILWCENLIINC